MRARKTIEFCAADRAGVEQPQCVSRSNLNWRRRARARRKAPAVVPTIRSEIVCCQSMLAKIIEFRSLATTIIDSPVDSCWHGSAGLANLPPSPARAFATSHPITRDERRVGSLVFLHALTRLPGRVARFRDPVRARINIERFVPQKTHQRLPAFAREFHSQARRRRDCTNNRNSSR